MVIQHNNYEQYITDYLDGTLSSEQTKAMDIFFRQYPDLLDEAIAIQEYTVPKTTFILDEDIKASLLKKEANVFSIAPSWKMGIAASLLLLLTFTNGFFLNTYNKQTSVKLENQHQFDNQIEPVLPKVEPIPAKSIIKENVEKQVILTSSQKKASSKKLPVKKKRTIVTTQKKEQRYKKSQIALHSQFKENNLEHKTEHTILAKAIKPIEPKPIPQKKNIRPTDAKPVVQQVVQKPVLIAKVEIPQDIQPKIDVASSEKKTQQNHPKKAKTSTEERVFAKNDSLKSIHKTSLHELFTDNEIVEQENEIKNRRFVRKTGKFLKSVLNIEEISKEDMKQAFIPKSIKIKKEK